MKDGRYFAQPFESLDSGTDDANLMLAAWQKYGPKDLALDSIAQAGGEAKNPGRNLPLAIAISVLSAGVFYMLFAAAVFAWNAISGRSDQR